MMKNVLKLISVLLVALFFLVPTRTVAASSNIFDGQVIFGQTFTLKSGDTMEGNLLVFGGSATIEKDATVNGSVVLFGGNLNVDGTVNGDVAVTGGQVKLGSDAHVTGNLTTVAASLERADGAKVDGQIFNTSTTSSGVNGSNPPVVTPPVINVPAIPAIGRLFSVQVPDVVKTFVNAFSQAVFLALLAMLLMLFLAPHVNKVSSAIISQPLTAGGLGLLTVIAVPIAAFLIGITIILIPVSIIIILALVVASIFGWIAVGYEVGQRFTKAIHQNWHPAFSAGLGVFTLTLVARALTAVPGLNCITGLAIFLLIIAAVGAVIMTRFGVQMVSAPVRSTPAAPVNPPDQNPS